VLEPLKSIGITEGDSVILSTQIVATPTAKIVWYKDGKQLKFDSKNIAEKV
jgi:Immunoglobulin I-set domain